MKKTLSIILAMLTVACTYPGRSAIATKTSEKKARASSSEKTSNKTRTLNLKKVSNKKTNFQKKLSEIKNFVLDTLPISIPIAALSMYALWKSRKPSSSPNQINNNSEELINSEQKSPSSSSLSSKAVSGKGKWVNPLGSNSSAIPIEEEWVNYDLGRFMSDEAKIGLINSDTCDSNGLVKSIGNISVNLPRIEVQQSTRRIDDFRNYEYNYGQILGDILGAPYEFLVLEKDPNKVQLHPGLDSSDSYIFDGNPDVINFSGITDDSALHIATGNAFIEAFRNPNTNYWDNIITFGMKYMRMQNLFINQGRQAIRFKNGGFFGGSFNKWCRDGDFKKRTEKPSCGNGGAMRGSLIGILFDDPEDVMIAARMTAELTHSHIFGVLGTQMLAMAVRTARLSKRAGRNNTEIKQDIKDIIWKWFGVELGEHLLLKENIINMSGKQIEPYSLDRREDHCETTLTVPQAIYLVVKNDSIEGIMCDINALGFDTDTQGAIALPIAEFIYGVPEKYKRLVEQELTCSKPAQLKFQDKTKQEKIQQRVNAIQKRINESDLMHNFDEMQDLILKFEKYKNEHPGQRYFTKN